MLKCPHCFKSVKVYKTNSHVIPRFFFKKIKIEGKFIKIAREENKINEYQTDLKGDYICDSCEQLFAVDDTYGAKIMIDGKGVTKTLFQGEKAEYLLIKGFDYEMFKKFLVSIVLRDHYYRKQYSEGAFLSEEELSLYQREYDSPSLEKLEICGYILPSDDPLSRNISPPVPSQDKKGVSFQLLGSNFLIYHQESRFDISKIKMQKDGSIFFIVRTWEQTGNLKDFDKLYDELREDSRNAKELKKIDNKYN